jgi:hypothetical protein
MDVDPHLPRRPEFELGRVLHFAVRADSIRFAATGRFVLVGFTAVAAPAQMTPWASIASATRSR